MTELQSLLLPKIFEVVERAGISTSKQIIILSNCDLEKLTHLCREDILLLKNTVAQFLQPKCITLNLLASSKRVTSGCEGINKLLKGGYHRGAITEIYGESGSGKTQIALQAAAHNYPNCTLYICTEDLFPIKRFNEVKKGIPDYNHLVDYGSSVFVEHITEGANLLSCVRTRLPNLLKQNNFSLIVIDSIAGPFRVETTNYVQRAEDLRELAISLLNLAQKFNLAVICINQVSASLEGPVDLLPSLGLAWSNMVNTRLYLRKTLKSVRVNDEKDFEHSSHVRELAVIFAPDLPNLSIKFMVRNIGLQSLD